ncbi:MAG: hypothetical protein JZU50_03720 [Desulfobulbaceae bacterium]|nr:hypothetical protein [Desulfobulbaceae bacterium]
MGLPDHRKLTIQTICNRWNKTTDYVLYLAENGELGVWINLSDVLVEEESNETPMQYHEKFELKLIPQDLLDLTSPDVRIEVETLNGICVGEYENNYVRVHRMFQEDGKFIIDLSKLYVHAEEVLAFEAKYGVTDIPPLTLLEEQLNKSNKSFSNNMIAEGKKATPTEAIALHNYFLENENSDILAPGEMSKFIERLEILEEKYKDSDASLSSDKGQQQEINLPIDKAKRLGRPKAQLTEAVEFLYDKFYKEGNTEILKEGNVQEFIKRLQGSIDENNQNYSDYVAERIKEVKKPGGAWMITTQEIMSPGVKYMKSKIKSIEDVSKALHYLREKKQLIS